jgi:hypothetical protein
MMVEDLLLPDLATLLLHLLVTSLLPFAQFAQYLQSSHLDLKQVTLGHQYLAIGLAHHPIACLPQAHLPYQL